EARAGGGATARAARVSEMPKSNGNMWNMAGNACNRLVAERMEMRKHEAHLRALENTRGAVDSKKPRDHVHLRHKAKTKKLQEDRAADIQLENRILLQKMLSIDTKPSQAFKDLQAPPPARTLHGVAQRRELDRITDANQSLLQRLQNAKPTIDPIKWEDEEVDRQALKFRLSQNSSRARIARLRLPTTLPRIPGAGSSMSARRPVDEEWAELTAAELDQKVREMEGLEPRREALGHGD
ncbi:unnamed protein product, partial [Prorocentrum cordatum]